MPLRHGDGAVNSGICPTEPSRLDCSSKQVDDFLSWIKQQDFYENTTVVIVGDHGTMDVDFLDDIDSYYERTMYN